MELKEKMTFDEMAAHMEENTYRLKNRINVGIWARENGFKPYKPMINGMIHFFYVRGGDSTCNNGTHETCKKSQ